MKLFSPVIGYCYYKDEVWNYSDRSVDLSQEELCEHVQEIREAIQRYNEDFSERGLAEYLDEGPLASKIISMVPGIEEWQGKLWGVLDVKCKERLSEEELADLIREWEGQESDGWGEGFEQQKIEIYEAELYVNFWNSGREFFIKTEEELKGGMVNEVQTIRMLKGMI